MPDLLSDDQRRNLSERESKRSCGDEGPTLHGWPDGLWEKACAAVAEEQARMKEIRKAQIESLRSMSQAFSHGTDMVARFIKADLDELADRVEFGSEDLETILAARRLERP